MRSTDEQAVQNAIARLFEAWRSLDPEQFAAVFPDDAQFTDVVGQTARGSDGIARQHVVPFTRLFRHATVTVGETPVTFLTPDVASVSAQWSMQGHVGADGEPLPPRHGLMHIVLVQRGGGWEPVVVHNTDHTGAYS